MVCGMRRIVSVIAAVAVLFGGVAAAEVKLATIFGDGMILQRGKSAPVWGLAEPGEKVTVAFAGQAKTAAAGAGGRWMVELDPLTASTTPESLTITPAGGKPVTVADVLVGDVWIFLGMRNYPFGREDCSVPYAVNRACLIGWQKPEVNSVPQQRYAPDAQPVTWKATRGTQHNSVTGHFANALHEATGVPIGVIRIKTSNLEAITPYQGFGLVPALADEAREIQTWFPATSAGRRAYAKWQTDTKAWIAATRRGLTEGETVTASQPPAVPGPQLGDAHAPTVAFNERVNPLVPLAFKGLIQRRVIEGNWSTLPMNVWDADYAYRVAALVKGFRAVFDQPDLPYCGVMDGGPNNYYTEVFGAARKAAIHGHWRGAAGRERFAGFKDRQMSVLKTLPGAGLVWVADLGPGSAIAARLTRWALVDVYRKGKGTAIGPVYKSHRFKGNRAIIEFDNVGKRLMTARKRVGRPARKVDQPVRFLQIAGPDKVWRSARGKIADDGRTLIAWSDKVASPVAVRYAYQSEVIAQNLYNNDGLPAFPFRTDNWGFPDPAKAFEAAKVLSAEQLVARLGYPADVESLAAANALAAKGPSIATVLDKLLTDADRDVRCGAIHAYGYLHNHGTVPDRYRDVTPPTPTKSSAAALARIDKASKDVDPWVRVAALDALMISGMVTPRALDIAVRLADDTDGFVRARAIQLGRLRIHDNSDDTCVALAMGTLTGHLTDNAEATIRALSLLSRYAGRSKKTDYLQFARSLGKLETGQVPAEVLYRLGNLRTSKIASHLGHEDVRATVLHLYSLGADVVSRLYANENFTAAVPRFRTAISEWKAAAAKLELDRPAGWQDRKRRYQRAAADLEKFITATQARLNKGR